MEQHNKHQQSNPDNNDPARFTDEVTEKKIDRHLHDINDTISGEDIKNVISDISSPALPEDDLENTDKEPLDIDDKPEDKNDKHDPLPTSWNVLE